MTSGRTSLGRIHLPLARFERKRALELPDVPVRTGRAARPAPPGSSPRDARARRLLLRPPRPFRNTGTTGFIDLYKRGCFVLEAKQGSASGAAAHPDQLSLLPDAPRLLPEQMAAVRAALVDAGEAAPADIARRFRRARADSVKPLLETLAALGHARATGDGRFAA